MKDKNNKRSMFLLTYLTLLPSSGSTINPELDNLQLIFSNLKIVWALLKQMLAYEAKLFSTFHSTL